MSWNITADTFTFQAVDDNKPFTFRGVLSTLNTLYDPLGFLATVTIQGRLLLRELSMRAEDWDSPLATDMEEKFNKWRDSLQDLQEHQIPRTYTFSSTSNAQLKELCVFAYV